MNKGELVDRMAKAAGISKMAADKAITEFTSAVTETLKSGEKVTLIGFGTFLVSDRKARTGRNPRTGAALKIPAKKMVRFKPGTKLSESV